jgi:hypothetical protein
MYGATALALRTLEHAGFRNGDPQIEARRRGSSRFWRAHFTARLARFWARVAGHPYGLQALDQAVAGRLVRRQRPAGECQVSLANIVGSEGRSADFDLAFRPLQPHHRDRWLNIFAARATGVTLPPVDLIQVGRRYYIRDGHHRISVAQALGQVEVDATVTCWELCLP